MTKKQISDELSFYIEDDDLARESMKNIFFIDLLFEDVSDDIQRDIITYSGMPEEYWKGKPVGVCQFPVAEEKANA